MGRLRTSQGFFCGSRNEQKTGPDEARGVQPVCLCRRRGRPLVSRDSFYFLSLAVNNRGYTSTANHLQDVYGPTCSKQSQTQTAGGGDRKCEHSVEMKEEEMMRNVSQLQRVSRTLASRLATCESALFPAERGCVNDNLFSCWSPQSKVFPHKVTLSCKKTTNSVFLSFLSALSSPGRLPLKSSTTAGKTNSVCCLLQNKYWTHTVVSIGNRTHLLSITF